MNSRFGILMRGYMGLWENLGVYFCVLLYLKVSEKNSSQISVLWKY
jgi:hypothetical protein